MKKIVVFGSKYCPDCPPIQTLLKSLGLEYTYEDVSDGMRQLWEFLQYRDRRPEFDRIKAQHAIGVPCIVINDGEAIFFQDLSVADLQASLSD
jgi:glutaredoxin-related protein